MNKEGNNILHLICKDEGRKQFLDSLYFFQKTKYKENLIEALHAPNKDGNIPFAEGWIHFSQIDRISFFREFLDKVNYYDPNIYLNDFIGYISDEKDERLNIRGMNFF